MKKPDRQPNMVFYVGQVGHVGQARYTPQFSAILVSKKLPDIHSGSRACRAEEGKKWDICPTCPTGQPYVGQERDR